MRSVRQSWTLLLWLALSPLRLAPQELQAYSRAEAFVRQGQYGQGIALLRPLLETEPRNLKALNLLGIALTQKGELAAANHEYVRALQVDPRFLAALKNLAINEFTLKDFAASEKHFREASKIAPNDPVVNAFLGRIVFSHKDFSLAAAHLAKAGYLLTQDPSLFVALVQSQLEIGKDAEALSRLAETPSQLPLRTHFELGLLLAKHNHFEQATPLFYAVRAKFPGSYDAGFDLAVCYVEIKQYADAITVLTDLRISVRKTAELDNLLAEAYKGADQVQPAIDALREATELAPEDEDNYLDLVTLCIDHNSFDLAMEILGIGLHYRPQSDRLIFQRGIVHAMKNQFDLADQDFQLASQLAPEKNLSYAGLSVSYIHTGNLPEAIATLRQRVKVKPEDSLLQYLLGETLIRSGTNPGESTFAEAKNAFARSVKLNPQFAPSNVQLGKLALREGRVDEAIILLEKARSLDPMDKAAYSQLAIAYRRQGKVVLATNMLSDLAKLNDEERAKDSRGRQRLVREDSDSESKAANP